MDDLFLGRVLFFLWLFWVYPLYCAEVGFPPLELLVPVCFAILEDLERRPNGFVSITVLHDELVHLNEGCLKHLGDLFFPARALFLGLLDLLDTLLDGFNNLSAHLSDFSRVQ